MSDEVFGPGEAAARIAQAEEAVRAGRRQRSGWFTVVGVLALAYFAVFAIVMGDSNPFGGAVITIAPAILVIVLADTWGRRRSVESRRQLRLEGRLTIVVSLLTCVAGLLAVLLPHPFPAVLAGLLPAVPCFAVAWRAARS